jgi:sugar/nucleoside kinase (ribokinase family)
MISSPEVDIMMIGHFAKDRLVVDGRVESASGGAVYYGSVALCHLGKSVAVVTRLHPDDFSLLDELREDGVQVFAVPAAETSGIENIYDSADMERRICRPLGFAGAFRPEQIPDLDARIYVAASIIAGEIDLPMLKNLARRGPVALDVQGFVRVREDGRPSTGGPASAAPSSGPALVFRQWPEMEEGLAHVAYLKVDRAEAELLTGETDLQVAARQLTEYGPGEVVVTQSSGVTVFAEGRIHEAPFTSRSLNGRTGRGDTCFATYLGGRLTRSPEEATRLAAAITSRKQEKPGPWRGSIEDLRLEREP